MRYILAAVMIVLLSSVALAVPSQPHRFYGTVTVNGAPASDGTTVSARIYGIGVASTTTADGRYGYSPVFYIADPNSVRAGSTIEFFVDDVSTGQTATFVNGKSTSLNLTVTITAPSDGGSPGGSSGSEATTTTTIVPGVTTTTICQESWTCSDWSACKDGIETRLCFDENQCGTENDRPFESNPCSAEEADSSGIDMTGLFAGVVGNPFVGIVVVIIVVTAVYLIKFRKKATGAFKPIPF